LSDLTTHCSSDDIHLTLIGNQLNYIPTMILHTEDSVKIKMLETNICSNKLDFALKGTLLKDLRNVVIFIQTAP